MVQSERDVQALLAEVNSAFATEAEVTNLLPLADSVLRDLDTLMRSSFTAELRELLDQSESAEGLAELKRQLEKAIMLVAAFEAFGTLAGAVAQRLSVVISSADGDDDPALN